MKIIHTSECFTDRMASSKLEPQYFIKLVYEYTIARAHTFKQSSPKVQMESEECNQMDICPTICSGLGICWFAAFPVTTWCMCHHEPAHSWLMPTHTFWGPCQELLRCVGFLVQVGLLYFDSVPACVITRIEPKLLTDSCFVDAT